MKGLLLLKLLISSAHLSLQMPIIDTMDEGNNTVPIEIPRHSNSSNSSNLGSFHHCYEPEAGWRPVRYFDCRDALQELYNDMAPGGSPKKLRRRNPFHLPNVLVCPHDVLVRQCRYRLDYWGFRFDQRPSTEHFDEFFDELRSLTRSCTDTPHPSGSTLFRWGGFLEFSTMAPGWIRISFQNVNSPQDISYDGSLESSPG